MTESKKRGRPKKPESEKKKYWGTKLAPDVRLHITKQPNMSAYVERVVRADMESENG